MDFPIKNGGSFHSYVNVYQRVGKQEISLPSILWKERHQDGGIVLNLFIQQGAPTVGVFDRGNEYTNCYWDNYLPKHSKLSPVKSPFVMIRSCFDGQITILHHVPCFDPPFFIDLRGPRAMAAGEVDPPSRGDLATKSDKKLLWMVCWYIFSVSSHIYIYIMIQYIIWYSIIYIYIHSILPVVPHKAVAEVSEIGNL